MLERGLQFKVDRVVGFTKVLAPLRVADDYMRATDRRKHWTRNLSRERTFVFPVNILCADCNLRVLNCFERCLKIKVRRTDHNLVPAMLPNQWQKLAEKFSR